MVCGRGGRKNGLPQPACVKYLSSFVPRKTFVSRPKVGDPMGAEPPWSSGRESRGDRLEIGPLGRAFAFFRRAAKEGRSRRSETTLVQTLVPAAAVTSPPLALRETASGPPPLKGRQDRLPFRGAGAKRLRGYPAAAGNPPGLFRIRRTPLRFVPLSRRLRRASFFARPKKEAKEMRQREPRRRTGEWPVSGFWPNTGKIPPAPPLQIETVRFDLRRTFRRNLPASSREGTRRAAVGARSIWEGNCAVLRRIRTRLRPP